VRLERDIAGEVVSSAGLKGFGEAGSAIVGGADIAHFPGLHEVVESLEGVLERRVGIIGVCLVEVDVVGLQAAKGGFDCLANVLWL
jgi:hypothetical protein